METGDNVIGNAQLGSSLPTAIQDEELMPSERRFRHDGAKAAWFYQPNDGDDRMNENDEDVVHAPSYQNLKKSWNSGRFRNSPSTGSFYKDGDDRSADKNQLLPGARISF